VGGEEKSTCSEEQALLGIEFDQSTYVSVLGTVMTRDEWEQTLRNQEVMRIMVDCFFIGWMMYILARAVHHRHTLFIEEAEIETQSHLITAESSVSAGSDSIAEPVEQST
jgi:hypothetical protein